MVGDEVLDGRNAPPTERLLAASGHVSQRQAAVLPAVRAEVFRGPLLIPKGAGAAEHGKHESVRAFVQQQLATIEIRRLFIEPQPVVRRIAVLERRQVVGQQPGGGKA